MRGRVGEMFTGHEARAHIDELSQKHNGEPYPTPVQSERVMLKIAAERMAWHR
jgi:hypothetical protein